jgi:pimeloyl-ACP methyl ester carboxylesterase
MNTEATPRTSPLNPTTAGRRSRRHPALVASAVATLGLVAAFALPAPAASAAPLHHGSPKPTIVLVHGAWADGSSWNGEVKILQNKGYTVDVAPNPLRGVASDSAYLASFLATITGPIVLVGHSYGGFIITNAATGNPNVKALVYVDAFAPDLGESIGSLTAGSGSVLEPALTDPASVFNLRPFPGAPAGVVDAYVKPQLFITGFAGDLPRSEAAALAAEQAPLATNAFGEASGAPAWKTIPSWALIGTADLVIPTAGLEAMAHRAGAHIETVNGSHLSLISHPKETAGVIIDAAEATS